MMFSAESGDQERHAEKHAGPERQHGHIRNDHNGQEVVLEKVNGHFEAALFAYTSTAGFKRVHVTTRILIPTEITWSFQPTTVAQLGD